jgi:hypothetical protein
LWRPRSDSGDLDRDFSPFFELILAALEVRSPSGVVEVVFVPVSSDLRFFSSFLVLVPPSLLPVPLGAIGVLVGST